MRTHGLKCSYRELLKKDGEGMESSVFAERLMEFGLTRQEAAIYECLLREGKTTGYEVAKLIGISRSNAYNSLASMTEKGASYLVEEGTTRKYVPVPLDEFCKNRQRQYLALAHGWKKIKNGFVITCRQRKIMWKDISRLRELRTYWTKYAI